MKQQKPAARAPRRGLSRRNRALLEHAAEMEEPMLVDQYGNPVSLEEVTPALERLSDMAGEEPAMHGNSSSWLLVSAWDNIISDLSDPEAVWTPMDLVFATAELRQLERLMWRVGTLSYKGVEMAKNAADDLIACWLRRLAHHWDVDRI